MSAEALYDNIQAFLRVNSRIVEKSGNDINVDEKFKMRVTGSNAAYSANQVGKPRIVFDRPRVFVQGTRYTDVVGGDRWLSLPDQELFPRGGKLVDVELVAISEISSWTDFFRKEQVASVWIQGDLDQDRFFQI